MKIMGKNIAMALLIFAAFLLLPNFVLGAPSVSGLVGTVSDGQNVNILGSSFGVGATVISWDDFEAQATGGGIYEATPIIGSAYTTASETSLGATFSATRGHSGSKSALIDWDTDGISRIIAFGSNFTATSSLYMSYWRYMEYPNQELPATTNHKQWYLFGTETGPSPQGIFYIPQGNQGWGCSNNNSTITTYGTWDYRHGLGSPQKNWIDTINTWNRFEFWINLNSNLSCQMGSNCDGKRYEWIDSALYFADDLYAWRNNVGQYYEFLLGYMHGASDGTPDEGKTYFDDFYIATSPARVEIGDASTWSACAHREIQPPSAWSETSSTITINQGSFADDSTAYLYVVDENGDVNATGYPITFGTSGGDVTAPSTPSGLNVL